MSTGMKVATELKVEAGAAGIMAGPAVPPILTAIRSSSAPSSRPTSRKEVAERWLNSCLGTLDSAGMPSPKGIMTSLEGVELATFDLDEDLEAVECEDVTTTIFAQLELLSGSECNVVGAAATLTDMIQQDQAVHDQAVQEAARDLAMPSAVQDLIRTAGGIRSAVFLLKLSQTAGNQRIATAASRLLLHLARDNARNQVQP